MKVFWTEFAAEKWEQIASHILCEFGFAAMQEYKEETEAWQKTLADNPQIGPLEPLLSNRRYEYRSIVIQRKTKLVYYTEGDFLMIVNVWDTRQEPQNQADAIR